MTNLETITKMIANGQMEDSALESVVEKAHARAWHNAIVDTANELHRFSVGSDKWMDEDAINYDLNEICVSESLGFFYGGVQDPNCKIKVIPSIKQGPKGVDNTDEAMDSWSEWLDHFQMAVINHMIASDRFQTEFETKGYKEFTFKIRAK
jgi:hypothetical protein